MVDGFVNGDIHVVVGNDAGGGGGAGAVLDARREGEPPCFEPDPAATLVVASDPSPDPVGGVTVGVAGGSEWAALAQDPASRFSAFVYLEDDIELTRPALQRWAEDQALFEAGGLAAAGFSVTLLASPPRSPGHPLATLC